ncbi:MAG: hypothetical protein ACFFDN_10780 [Candidatus Hodarchaeota archaeon]
MIKLELEKEYTICDDCPCLFYDYEYDKYYCNNDFDFYEDFKDFNKHLLPNKKCFSNNCSLESIKFNDGKIYKPKRFSFTKQNNQLKVRLI